jgi:putative CocE/NonD family hydrolase
MNAPEASVVVERNLLIPLPDGAHLAADLYRPAGEGPWPAIVDYLPYHKDGRGGRLDVEAVNRHFAARGYAALTIDFRGLGNSSGVNPFPFDPQEARDGHVAVEWVAAQPWCDGNVGMWGVSYGGITALAVAATRPPHLRAIVPIHAGADLYHDVIAPGGCRGGFWLQADWGPRMVALNLTPPLWQDPDGRWERVWAAHLEANGPWLFSWWDHPDFDDFWASRVIPVERIEAATFNIGGWRDLYAEATVRDHARIRAPKRLLMGPWKHAFPDVALEAPAPGLHEMERWWERWLRGKDNGVASDPTVTLYVQGHDAGWLQGAAWPSPRVWDQSWRIGRDGVLRPATGGPGAARAEAPPVAGSSRAGDASAGRGPTRTLAHDPTVGIGSIGWDPWTTALSPDTPWDQSGDDARSLAFTSESLEAPLELRGSPQAVLDVSVSASPAHVVARLADVAPSGRSTLITLGWVDLALREGSGRRLSVEPDMPYRVTVPLRATAYRLAPGHRLRLSVATADFPRIWPTPRPFTLSLAPELSAIRLPVVRALDSTLPPPQWGLPEPEALHSPSDLGGGQRWETRHDLGEDMVTLDATKEEHLRLDGITRFHGSHRYAASVPSGRPDLCRMQSTTEVTVERPVTHTELTVTTVTTTHTVSITATITVDRSPYWTRTWSRRLGPDRPEGASPPSTR